MGVEYRAWFYSSIEFYSPRKGVEVFNFILGQTCGVQYKDTTLFILVHQTNRITSHCNVKEIGFFL